MAFGFVGTTSLLGSPAHAAGFPWQRWVRACSSAASFELSACWASRKPAAGGEEPSLTTVFSQSWKVVVPCGRWTFSSGVPSKFGPKRKCCLNFVFNVCVKNAVLISAEDETWSSYFGDCCRVPSSYFRLHSPCSVFWNCWVPPFHPEGDLETCKELFVSVPRSLWGGNQYSKMGKCSPLPISVFCWNVFIVFFFYSVEFSAAVLNEYSFAFCYLKCTFRVMSCCMDFALKPSGAVNWLNPCLTLRIKSALNFIAVYTIYFSEDKFLPTFHKWGTLHGIFWGQEDAEFLCV